MKYLVVSTNTKDISPFLDAETKRSGELHAAGVLVNGWVKSDFSGAAVLFEAADRDELTAVINTLPVVINDATTYVATEVIEMDFAPPGSE